MRRLKDAPCALRIRLLASVIVASEGATFHDVPTFAGGIVPGDESSRRGAIELGQAELRRFC